MSERLIDQARNLANAADAKKVETLISKMSKTILLEAELGKRETVCVLPSTCKFIKEVIAHFKEESFHCEMTSDLSGNDRNLIVISWI